MNPGDDSSYDGEEVRSLHPGDSLERPETTRAFQNGSRPTPEDYETEEYVEKMIQHQLGVDADESTGNPDTDLAGTVLEGDMIDVSAEDSTVSITYQLTDYVIGDQPEGTELPDVVAQNVFRSEITFNYDGPEQLEKRTEESLQEIEQIDSYLTGSQ